MKRLLTLLILAASPALASDYVLETSVITDWETISYYGSQEEAQQKLDTTIAYANALLTQQLGIDVHITYSDIPQTASDDTIANHTHPIALMDAVYEYVVNDQNHLNADITLMLTSRKLSTGGSQYVGWANIGSVCKSDSIAIVSLYDNGLDGQTLAHEIMHVLSAVHDGDAPCEDTDSRGYLMAAATHTGNDQMSQCSIDTVNEHIETSGSCLLEDNTSVPDVIVTEPPAVMRGGGSTELFTLLALLAVIVLGRR